jgi:hypothetical protein
MSGSVARTGSGRLLDDWGAKAIYVPCPEPWWSLPWVRRTAFAFACIAGLGLALGLAVFNRWHDDQLAELAGQRRSLDAFLRSEEFATFARSADAQLAALNNFIAARPAEIRALLPEVSARESALREVGWIFDVQPLPLSAAHDPGQVYRAQSRLLTRLARDGWRWGEAERRSARAHFVRLLTPAAVTYLRRSRGDDFPALALDRAMQEAALAAFAALHGPGASALRTERMFGLHASIGPAMFRAVAGRAG